MSNDLDWLTLDEMISSGSAPDDAWEQLLLDPDAHARWLAAMERRRWLEAFAAFAARAPDQASILRDARHAAARADRAGEDAGAFVATPRRSRLDAITATLSHAVEVAKSLPRPSALSGASSTPHTLPATPETPPEFRIRATWGTTEHVELPVDTELTIEGGLKADVWCVSPLGSSRWPERGWRIEAADGALVIVLTSPRRKKLSNAADAIARAKRVSITMIHPISSSGEKDGD